MKIVIALITCLTFAISGNCQMKEKNLLGGCWFVPHGATTNITFKSDNTFVFNDYNLKKGKEERLTGKYLLVGNDLHLIYNDRPKQKVKLVLNKIDKEYRIRIAPPSPKYAATEFIHSECE